jgi:hypothetical protein
MLLIVKPFIMPVRIYMNTLRNLSNHENENSNEMLSKASLDYLLHTVDYKINLIIDNYPIKIFKGT